MRRIRTWKILGPRSMYSQEACPCRIISTLAEQPNAGCDLDHTGRGGALFQ